jgi:hypothetical protein
VFFGYVGFAGNIPGMRHFGTKKRGVHMHDGGGGGGSAGGGFTGGDVGSHHSGDFSGQHGHGGADGQPGMLFPSADHNHHAQFGDTSQPMSRRNGRGRNPAVTLVLRLAIIAFIVFVAIQLIHG